MRVVCSYMDNTTHVVRSIEWIFGSPQSSVRVVLRASTTLQQLRILIHQPTN